MSTTFGVKDPNTGIITKIAFRDNGGKFKWLHELAKILPNEMKVIPMDNTHQGIKTVGDIRKEIDEFGFFSNGS